MSLRIYWVSISAYSARTHNVISAKKIVQGDIEDISDLDKKVIRRGADALLIALICSKGNT